MHGPSILRVPLRRENWELSLCFVVLEQHVGTLHFRRKAGNDTRLPDRSANWSVTRRFEGTSKQQNFLQSPWVRTGC